ncbi:hypothetical protein IFM89_010678 [Coptis chinensis]|uniref:tRNA synthetases class I catalytic domain-containing protein n=1 Tax=Coptis chinensis TaxID=261450 RepID=A0A835HBS6_9MAGN|nr:hypothetical protein IFM89_010678 [Coptis chinensis]
MYICGVTAYDLSHIGHAHVYVSFDVLFRYLKHLEYEVCYVRNVTDVNDKIIARANELGEDPLSLSRCYFHEFRCDMSYLYCISPSVEPHVSDHMPQIIDIIKQVLTLIFMYLFVKPTSMLLQFRNFTDGTVKFISFFSFVILHKVDSDVNFSIDKFPECGRLSGRKLEDNRAGERVTVDLRKRNPGDFVLWKVIDLYHPLAMRLFLMGTHYRSPINYSNAQLESAFDRVFYIYQTLRDCEEVLSQRSKWIARTTFLLLLKLALINFIMILRYLCWDDLHTPAILAAMSDPLKTINNLLHTRQVPFSNLYQYFAQNFWEGCLIFVIIQIELFLLGKKQELRIQSLSALEEEIKSVLSVLELMPTSYAEVGDIDY